MPRIIVKCRYLKPISKEHASNYVRYIATRDGVDKIDDTHGIGLPTLKQQELIEKLLKDFPDSREMLEYDDYIKGHTMSAASEFISRTLEDNADQFLEGKTYADYIATRPRVEKFGTHGLFTNEGVKVSLSKVSEELKNHEGNVWTTIVSLRREDAERLGFNSGVRFRDMLRSQTETLSKNLKIPMTDMKWYASFHNESHHPHVHIIVYSDNPKQGYLTKQGIDNMRSLLQGIFLPKTLCQFMKSKLNIVIRYAKTARSLLRTL